MSCDLKCPQCYVSAGTKSRNELSTEEVKHLIVDPMVELGCPDLVVAGGEPLLRKDISEVLGYAHEKGLRWSMHTHGGFVRQYLPWIEKIPPIMVAVSLDGPSDYHDAFRGKEHSFDKAIDAMRALKDIGVDEVVAGTTVTRDNADLLVDMMPIVAASAADSWGLHLVAPEGRADAELLPTPAQLRRVAQMARRFRSFMRVELDNEWGGAHRGMAPLHAMLESHTRVAESFTLALGHTKVISPSPWMSKAARPKGYGAKMASPMDFLAEAKRRYTTQEAGTWETQARVAVALEGGQARLHRKGQAVTLTQQNFYLRQLDVLVTRSACRLRVSYLGLIEIPADQEVTSASLQRYLSDEGRQLLALMIAGVLTGDSESMERIAHLMPIAAKDLLAAVEKEPNAAGAATARSLLFDTDW